MKLRRIVVACGAVLVVYTGAYVIAYNLKSPAANLAYWCYTPGSWPDWTERSCYTVFWPAYKTHRAVFKGGRHNWDRAPIPAEALTQP